MSKKRYFDSNISKESISKMITCFAPQFKNFQAGETILAYSDEGEKVGIFLSGEGSLHYISEQGESSLLEVYREGDLFGDVFFLPLENYEYLVTAKTACRIVFISYNHLITPCQKVCPHHSQLINNLFLMTAQKAQELTLHISFLSHPTTRKKLIAYLQYVKNSYGVSEHESFEIPMTLGALSEYLCVERTAMMREIRLLKQDGILSSDRRTFRFLKE